MNIIANAIDAFDEYNSQRCLEKIKENSNCITIQTRMLGEDWISIAIADNGSGIPEAVRAKIFDAFFTTKGIGKGTGLGLSISHEIIVKKHAGCLRCVSEMGVGTTFIIEIPICRDLLLQ